MLRSINPSLANVPILYPLKTSENLWFSGVFRGYKIGTLARNGLMPFEQIQMYQKNFASSLLSLKEHFAMRAFFEPHSFGENILLVTFSNSS